MAKATVKEQPKDDQTQGEQPKQKVDLSEVMENNKPTKPPKPPLVFAKYSYLSGTTVLDGSVFAQVPLPTTLDQSKQFVGVIKQAAGNPKEFSLTDFQLMP